MSPLPRRLLVTLRAHDIGLGTRGQCVRAVFSPGEPQGNHRMRDRPILPGKHQTEKRHHTATARSIVPLL
jgi:hypothetical protein